MLVEVHGKRVPVKIFDRRLETAPPPPAQHASRAGSGSAGIISAPMQGTILKVSVEEGQEITAGEVICILEAMKMENHIVSTIEGTVKTLSIQPGQVVDTNQTLAVIE
jgi:acetyl-CoA/propionyl-CoA carboxylase biotin carboxyl carrier protein